MAKIALGAPHSFDEASHVSWTPIQYVLLEAITVVDYKGVGIEGHRLIDSVALQGPGTKFFSRQQSACNELAAQEIARAYTRLNYN